MSRPFITEKIAHGHMIQLDNRWLDEKLEWNRSIFEGLAFPDKRSAETVLGSLEELRNEIKEKTSTL